MLNLIIAYIPAVCIGISLGLIGGGGSILAVPVLVYVMEVPAKSAIAMSLVVVGIVSLIGVIPHWQQGNVNFKTAALFTPTAMLGAYIGARIASLPVITPTIQLLSFAAMMLIAAFLMIRKGTSQRKDEGGRMRDEYHPQGVGHEPAKERMKDEYHPQGVGHEPKNFSSLIPHPSSFFSKADDQPELTSDSEHLDQYQLLAISAEGLGVGLLTGFVGIGGGFMIIPALVLLGKTPMKEAVGTSLIIIAFKSVAGFLGYLGHVSMDWNLMMSFTVAASLGTILGAYLTNFVDSKQLEKVFGGFVTAVAIFILMQVYTDLA